MSKANVRSPSEGTSNKNAVVMSDFRKEKHNPMELIKKWWPDAYTNHIYYDPDMKASHRQYWRIEQSGGDGTLLFTIQLLQKLLVPFLNRTTHYKPTTPNDWNKVKDIKYIIGNIRHAIVFGRVELGGGKYPGQRERVRIAVKCEYVYS